MFKLLNIFCLFFSIGVQAQNYAPIAEFKYPDLISYNTPFDISFITDNSVLEADSFNLYLISSNRVEFNSVSLNSGEVQKELKIVQSDLNEVSGRVYKVVVPLYGDDYSINSVFQVLANCALISTEIIRFNLYGEFIKDNKVVAAIGKLTENFNNNSKDLISANIYMYKPGRLLKTAAKLEQNSNLSINLLNINKTHQWLGFWLRLSGSGHEIIKLVNRNTDKSIFTIGANRFQKFFVENGNGERENFTSDFYSRKHWNHIGLDINNAEGSLNFYLNGKPILSYQLGNSIDFNDFYFKFLNNGRLPFNIEQLRLIAHNNNQKKIIADSKYISLTPDTSVSVVQLNFDSSSELLNYKDNNIISYSGIKLVNSDAPIASRAPELNVQVGSTYNQLEWKAHDLNNAYGFIVERSTSDNDFKELANINASGSLTNKFTYIDAVSNGKNEIVYYRIKQINKDGSIVYSSQVKLGMGELEQFKVNQNYPNPFNPLTSIEVDLFLDTELEVIIYNLEGKEMAVLHKGFLSKGIHKFEFDAGHLPSGVYLYKVSAGSFSQTNKMLLTK